MEDLNSILSWGSPVGLGLFAFLSLSGVGMLFWGMSHASKAEEKRKQADKDK
jgi:hypothetical protein